MGTFNKINNYRKTHSTKETVGWLKNALLMRVRKYKRNTNDYKTIKIKEKDGILLKNKHKVFLFANVPFYDIGGGQRSSQLAKTFNKMGFPVYCIYALKSGESKIYKLEMPLCMHIHTSKISVKEIESLMNENDLAIFEAPIEGFTKFLTAAKEKKLKIVYESIDNWETSLGKDFLNKDVLNNLIESSDFVVGSAKPLVEQLKGYMKDLNIERKALYLANAVDEDLFSPVRGYAKPEDMVTGEKTFIYYGSLWGSWFDWDLIRNLAVKHPNYSFVMIGDVHIIVDLIKKLPTNIHFLGLKKQADLPAYLQYSDYAMIPFKVDEIGEYVSPLKIFEYISMEKKVLCTRLPDVEGYPNTYLGNTSEEWDKYIEEDKEVDKKAAKDFILHNNWRSRVINIYKEAYGKDLEKCDKKYYGNITIIVDSKKKVATSNCLKALLDNKKRYNYNIVVASTDDKNIEAFKKEYKENITYFKGNKIEALKKVKDDFVMFFNDEKLPINEFFFDSYLEVFSNGEKVGAVGNLGYLIDEKGYVYPILEGNYMYPSVIARCDIHSLDNDGIMFKKEVIESVKYTDPKKRQFDNELSEIIKKNGYNIYYCPYLEDVYCFYESDIKKNNDKKSVK